MQPSGKTEVFGWTRRADFAQHQGYRRPSHRFDRLFDHVDSGVDQGRPRVVIKTQQRYVHGDIKTEFFKRLKRARSQVAGGRKKNSVLISPWTYRC